VAPPRTAIATPIKSFFRVTLIANVFLAPLVVREVRARDTLPQILLHYQCADDHPQGGDDTRWRERVREKVAQLAAVHQPEPEQPAASDTATLANRNDASTRVSSATNSGCSGSG
jgi:hypothetical protein